MNRYNPETGANTMHWERASMLLDPEGDYVERDDHKTALAERDQIINSQAQSLLETMEKLVDLQGKVETASRTEFLENANAGLHDAIRNDREAIGLVEADPHQFSTRPCSTCAGISRLIGRPFGCDRKRNAR